MRALVTGGAGFVGSAVVRALLDEGFQVTCLVRASSALSNLKDLDVHLVEGDVADPASAQQALSGCQQAYHVAAFYSTQPDDAKEIHRVNVEGSRTMLLAAADAGLDRIVHTSTIGTVGRPTTGRLPNEDDLFEDWKGASAYARSKLEAEHIALDLASQGAPLVVVNPCAPVGARDIKPSSTGRRIVDYLSGRMPSFCAGGINFCSVDDVARGHLLAARLGQMGKRYILGHIDGNLSLDGFYRLMEQVSGVSRPGQASAAARARRVAAALKRRMERRSTEPPRDVSSGFRPIALTADPTRAVRELGLPQTPLEEAFRVAVHWFHSHGYVG